MSTHSALEERCQVPRCGGLLGLAILGGFSCLSNPRVSTVSGPAEVEAGTTPDCDNDSGIVISPLDIIEFDCTTRLSACLHRIELHVTNCSGAPLQLESFSIELHGRQNHVSYAEPIPSIAPGESWVLPFGMTAGTEDGELHVKLQTRDGRSFSSSVQVRVRNPALERKKAECEACQGDWGVHGMSGRLGCNCRMADAGTVCYDGAECGGECLYERTEELTKPAFACGSADKCIELPAKRLVGRCSEFKVNFGCHDLVPDGARPGPWVVKSRRCVD